MTHGQQNVKDHTLVIAPDLPGQTAAPHVSICVLSDLTERNSDLSYADMVRLYKPMCSCSVTALRNLCIGGDSGD